MMRTPFFVLAGFSRDGILVLSVRDVQGDEIGLGPARPVRPSSPSSSARSSDRGRVIGQNLHAAQRPSRLIDRYCRAIMPSVLLKTLDPHEAVLSPLSGMVRALASGNYRATTNIGRDGVFRQW